MKIRRSIGTFMWLLATALSGLIVMKAMGTQDPIISGIGLLGLLFATTGVFFAMDARRDRAFIATVLSFGMWITGELFLVPSEYNFWSATVTARAEREMDYQRQADGRRLILDNTAQELKAGTPSRPVGEIQADINSALAKTYGRKTLASISGNCADLSSPAIRFCKEVFALQKELAAAQSRSTKASLVWEANQRLDVDTSQAHGAHDYVTNFSKLTGMQPEHIAAVLTFITMWVLFFGRFAPGYLGWRQPKTAKASVPSFPIVEAKAEAAPVTEEALPKPAIVTEAVPDKMSEPEPVTEAAEAANDNAVTEAAPEEEPAPVTAKKGRKKKQAEEIDWSNVTALVPKIHLAKTDHVTAAIDAVIDSGLAGHHLTPAIGRKRVNAILKHKHVKPISQSEYDRWSRERCNVRGVTCESLVGRQLRFKQSANSKKENTRLGSAIPA